ncbi:hypothetical protein PACTADRAFT_50020 [Pachysolen tannophilus NRRL Y-2460]|uniref:Palmitoyltransferase n=1 Tax=Pachysolen tannophilus NRRL Y-2460 TaxID=669874 RepID=A0A1E4TU72_PACTA|nr:hypothetical protein PACTADRAFT_50020 [Pachysolen tannophilus NRRL Y-2460]
MDGDRGLEVKAKPSLNYNSTLGQSVQNQGFQSKARTSVMAYYGKKFVPLLVVLGLGYHNYSYCYRFCWTEVHDRLNHHSVCYGLLFGFNFIQAILLIIWLEIFIVGPGRLKLQIPPYDLSMYFDQTRNDVSSQGDFNRDKLIYNSQIYIEAPDFFICNFQGLPFWCSKCNSLKLMRSHHYNGCNACIKRFDHYCIWIGAVIGSDNYKFFISILIWFLIYFIFTVASVSAYASDIKDYETVNLKYTLNPNLIFLYIVDNFWILIVSALLGCHLFSIKRNVSTVEELQISRMKRAARKRHRKNKYSEVEESKEVEDHLYVNAKHPLHPKVRFVVRLTDKDYPYNKGFNRNWREVMGDNFLNWFNPIKLPKMKNAVQNFQDLIDNENNLISDNFKKEVLKRIDEGNCVQFGSY